MNLRSKLMNAHSLNHPKDKNLQLGKKMTEYRIEWVEVHK